MAFDGITIAAICDELDKKITGGRISKIAQPENDELIITVKNNSKQYRVFMSADASLPLIYLTEINKTSPITAPGFCMLLRKYLQNAKIISIIQPGFERIIRIELEHLDELGDVRRKTLIIEIMGKHSNIILVDDQERIIDSIKHVSGMISSVREVIPGRDYFVATQNKKNPLLADSEDFLGSEEVSHIDIHKALYTEYTGISPWMAGEIIENAKVDGRIPVCELEKADKAKVYEAFAHIMYCVKTGGYRPYIYYENGEPKEYTVIDSPHCIGGRDLDSVSMLLATYYAEKNLIIKIRQHSGDLRRIVQNLIERDSKKCDLWIKQLKDAEAMETYKLYGELLTAYCYNIEKGREATVLNYYNNETVTIALDENKSISDNAKRYYEKYNKLKRTKEAVANMLEKTDAELMHLKSIMNSLDIARSETDLIEIKQELVDCGFIRRHGNEKIRKVNSKPFHYISSDGFDIYVGKNNYQNDALTFKFAVGQDMWFHAKKAPGSHVIVKTNGKELPDRTYEEAAALAAFYSSIKNQSKPEIDYTLKKNVKKPSGAAPGFVVYYTNYSMIAEPVISGIKQVDD